MKNRHHLPNRQRWWSFHNAKDARTGDPRIASNITRFVVMCYETRVVTALQGNANLDPTNSFSSVMPCQPQN